MIRYATLLSGRSAGAGTTYATWNSGAKGPDLSLSSGNLVVARVSTANGFYQAVRANQSLSGKRYWELKVGTLSGGSADSMLGAGVATVDGSPLDATETYYVGYMQDSCAIWDGGGVYSNNAIVGTDGATSIPWTWTFAFDATTRKFWVGDTQNGWISGDPATGTSPLVTLPTGTYFPAVCFGPYLNTTQAANFGASAWAGTLPSGFSGVHS